ncbi:MAG: RDD family protein [Bacillaceae bacterium]
MFQSLTSPRFGKVATRFASFIIDVFVISLLYGLIVGVVSGNMAGIFSRFNVSTGNHTIDFFVGCFIFLLYFSLLQAYWNGQTIGMKMIGIKAVNVEGEKITTLQAFLRNIFFLTTTILTVGITVVINYILLVFTVKQNTIHDMLSKTYIENVKK